MAHPASDYRLSWLGYYGDFAAVPLAAVLALLWLFSDSVRPEAFASALIAGVLAWSLTEYVIHRFVFHGVEPYREQHFIHHIAPEDFIGASSWLTLPVCAALGFVLPFLLGRSVGIGLFVGLLAGYWVYIVVHDRFHHGRDLRGWMRRLYDNHEYHHRRTKVNFGVSSPLWDIVFGTYARPVVFAFKKR